MDTTGECFIIFEVKILFCKYLSILVEKQNKFA